MSAYVVASGVELDMCASVRLIVPRSVDRIPSSIHLIVGGYQDWWKQA